MARTAVVRSASLAPSDARLADELAEAVADGSFSQLTQLLLRAVGGPLKQQIDDLRASGLDPHERLFGSRPTPADTDAMIQDFYAPSSWPQGSGRA
jgi:hypothetical protein